MLCSTHRLLSTYAGPNVGPVALCGAVYDLAASRRDAFGDCGVRPDHYHEENVTAVVNQTVN